jgi:hypothetical protein
MNIIMNINNSHGCSDCQQGITIIPCINCTDSTNKCGFKMDAECVFYNYQKQSEPSLLHNIGYPNNTNLKLILEKIDELLGVTGNIILANNGLNKTGNTIKLGGSLLNDTIIDTSIFNFSINGQGSIYFGNYPNTRSDTVIPINLLYTDEDGQLLSLNINDSQGLFATTPAPPINSVQYNNGGNFGGSLDFLYYPETANLLLSNNIQSSPSEAIVQIELNNTSQEPFGLTIKNTSYTTTTAGDYYGIGFKAYNAISGSGTAGFTDLLALRRNAANTANEWISLVRWGNQFSSVPLNERIWDFAGRTTLRFNATSAAAPTLKKIIDYGIKISSGSDAIADLLLLDGSNHAAGQVIFGPVYDPVNNNHVSRLILRTSTDNNPYSEIIFRKGLNFDLGRWTNSGSLIVGTGTEIATAALQINSTTRGILPPRMTQLQRLAIPVSASSVGLHVYQTDGTEGPYVYTSGGWKAYALI